MDLNQTHKMKKLIRPFILLSLVIAGLSSNAQDPLFSIGADVSYSLTPVKQLDYYDWYVSGWTGNFSPAISVSYGDKISGVFRSVYIRNRFENETIMHANGGTGTTYYTTDVHQVYFDFLFEYAFKGHKGMYLRAGPSFGVPVHIKMSVDKYFDGYQDWEEHTNEVLKADYFSDFQGVIGYGAKIPIKGKNLIRIENNIRIGIMKIPVQVDDADIYGSEARTIAIQFILGYIGNIEK